MELTTLIGLIVKNLRSYYYQMGSKPAKNLLLVNPIEIP
jgi:hypothetical protein